VVGNAPSSLASPCQSTGNDDHLKKSHRESAGSTNLLENFTREVHGNPAMTFTAS
jgi:hypothetical protein